MGLVDGTKIGVAVGMEDGTDDGSELRDKDGIK